MSSSRRRRPEGVEYRVRSDGTTVYRVKWREGGCRDGAQRSRTFGHLDEAVTFRGALVANGYRDPYDDPAWAERLGLAVQPTQVRTFEAVAAEYLATLVDAQRRTVAEYRRQLATHVYPAVVRLPDGRRFGPLGSQPVDRFSVEVIQAWIGYMRTKTHGGKAARRYSAKTIRWNCGYATEATRLLARFGIEQLALHRVCASHGPDNPFSGRVLLKAGMTYEGTLRQNVVDKGARKDSLVYAVLAGEAGILLEGS